MRIAVVGGGPVGVATAGLLGYYGHDVQLAEVSGARRSTLALGGLPFREPGLERVWLNLVTTGRVSLVSELDPAWKPQQVWISVGTPSRFDGRADLTQVYDVVRGMTKLPPGLAVMRSTVPVGTGSEIAERLRHHGWTYASHPEFLREGHAFEDLESPARMVLGVEEEDVADLVLAVYKGRIQTPVVVTDIASAELAKLASNAFLACRISFMNEMSLLADRVGADIGTVAKVMGLDPRIGSQYLEAGLGYGGSCFPKDTHALRGLGEDQDVSLDLLRAVITINNRMPSKILERVQNVGCRLASAVVAVWGLTFKPETDDLRESPAVALVDLLRRAGATVRVHDPAATNFHREDVRQCATAIEATDDATVLILATAWPEYLRQDPSEVVRRMKRGAIVADGRNALDPELWLEAGATYISLGARTRSPLSSSQRDR